MIIYHDYANTDEKLKTKSKRHIMMNNYLRWKYSDIDQFRIQYIKILPESAYPVHLSPGKVNTDNKSIYNPLISICIPTHNRAVYLDQTIQIALKQNYNNCEIIIVDDGSIDNTRQLVESINSKNLKYFYKKNSGAPDTRNRCIDEANGDFILWLDDDDILIEDIIESYTEVLNNYPDTNIVYGELESFDNKGNVLHKHSYMDWYNNNSGMIEFLVIGSPMPHPASMVSKKIYSEIGGYNKNYKRAHDFELWSRVALAEKYKCKYLPQVVCRYRIHETNITGEYNSSTDFSYEASILKFVIKTIGYEKLFQRLDWINDKNKSFDDVFLKLAIRFIQWNDILSGVEYFIKSMKYGSNAVKKGVLKTLINNNYLKSNLPDQYKKLRELEQNKNAKPEGNSDKDAKMNLKYQFAYLQITVLIFKGCIKERCNQIGNYELVVLDDSSNNKTSEIVKSFDCSKINYIKKGRKESRPVNRNECLKYAKGEYILWLDDDDILTEGIVQKYRNILKSNPSIDVIYGDLQCFDSQSGKKLHVISAEDYSNDSSLIISNIINGKGITFGGSAIRKEAMINAGGFNEEFLRAEDNELWTRFALKAKFYKLNEIIYYYRIHDDNDSFRDFIDRSYESKIIRKAAGNYKLKEIFPQLNWQNENEARNQAITNIAKGLFLFGDYFNSARLLEEYSF